MHPRRLHTPFDTPHLAADGRCRPLVTALTAGQRHDSLVFTHVLDRVKVLPGRGRRGRSRTCPDRVLADKAYSSRAARSYLRRRGIRATIPQPKDQVGHRKRRGSHGGRPPAFDPVAYKDRNTVERAVNKLRQFRAVATRYDKRAYVYQGSIHVATIRIWLNDPTQNPLRDTP